MSALTILASHRLRRKPSEAAHVRNRDQALVAAPALHPGGSTTGQPQQGPQVLDAQPEGGAALDRGPPALPSAADPAHARRPGLS